MLLRIIVYLANIFKILLLRRFDNDLLCTMAKLFIDLILDTNIRSMKLLDIVFQITYGRNNINIIHVEYYTLIVV